jgi:hypothetical protein
MHPRITSLNDTCAWTPNNIKGNSWWHCAYKLLAAGLDT